MKHRPVATAILNPSTGRRKVQEIESVLREVLSGRIRLTIRQTEYENHATMMAREAAKHSDLVIAVGGDGTVGECATGILGTETRLAIIPAGSTNVIARGLGIPLDIRKAAQVLLGPTEIRVLDAAIVDGRVALHMVGCGFDASMFEDAPRSLKRAAAWIAYVPSALKHVTDRPWSFDITIDGRTISTEARMVLVANGSFVVDPRFEVGRDIRADDGLLDIVIFSPPNLAATTSVASWLAVGQIGRSQYVRQLRGKRVRIESEPPAPVESDGDVIGKTPVTIEIAPHAIGILVPRRTNKSAQVSDAGSANAPSDNYRVQEESIWTLR